MKLLVRCVLFVVGFACGARELRRIDYPQLLLGCGLSEHLRYGLTARADLLDLVAVAQVAPP